MSDEEDLQKHLNDLFIAAESTTNVDSQVWLTSIRDKLFTMLCSPMKEEYSSEAFKWVSQLCIAIGDLSWLSSENSWTSKEWQMFACISRLSMTELSILLPTIERHLSTGEEPDIEEGKVLARSATSEDYDKFGDHLIIIESVIKILVKYQSEDEKETVKPENSLTSQQMHDLLNNLKETMTLICDYLELVNSRWKTLQTDTDNQRMTSAVASLRIMSFWLSEEPFAFETQCKRFMIDLMLKSLMISDESTPKDLIVTALHSICTCCPDLLAELRRQPGHKEALEKYLKYVEKERDNSSSKNSRKMFKLRCGLVRDLMMS